MSKTILALGAHYDDCPFGIPGILLKAVRQHHRVVILSLIGDYTNWPPVQGREQDLRQKTIDMARERGMEMRFLNYASMGFESNLETKRAVAEVVADVAPDTAFMLWHRDRHPDHEVVADICHSALLQPARLLGKASVKVPNQIYWYDNGPGHTIDFVPDTYVDITAEWDAAAEWLAGLMAFVGKKPVDVVNDPAVEVKRALARYRGLASGAKYAEALRSVRPVAREWL